MYVWGKFSEIVAIYFIFLALPYCSCISGSIKCFFFYSPINSTLGKAGSVAAMVSESFFEVLFHTYGAGGGYVLSNEIFISTPF